MGNCPPLLGNFRIQKKSGKAIDIYG